MYNTKQLKMFRNKYICRLIAPILLLIFACSIESCGCGDKKTYANIGMNVEQTSLIGDQKDIPITFQMDNSGTTAIVANFKLRFRIVEQKNVNGATTGTAVKYQEVGNIQKTITDAIENEKPLTSLTTFLELSAQEIAEFTTKFTLIPAKDVVQVKLSFELLDNNNKVLQTTEVDWMQSPIVINCDPLIEKISTFTICNLQEDIQDLSKLVVEVISRQSSVAVLLGDLNKSKATLKELLPGTTKLLKGELSKPIKITVKDPDAELVGNLKILVYSSDAAANSTNLAQHKVKWAKFTKDAATPEEAKQREEYIKIKQKKKETLQKKKELDEEKARLAKERKEAQERFVEEKDQLTEDKNKKLDQLRKEKAEALKSKNQAEQQPINAEYAAKEKGIIDKFNQDVKAAEKRRDDILGKTGEQEQEAKKQDQKLTEELRDEEDKERKGKAGLDKKTGKEGGTNSDSTSTPQVTLALDERKNLKDPRFTISLNKSVKAWDEKYARGINIWYEIEDNGENTSKLLLKNGKKIAIKPNEKVSLSKFFEGKQLASIIKNINNNKPQKLSFTIDGAQNAKSVKLILHVEDGNNVVPPVTVEWQNGKTDKPDKKGKNKNS